MVNMADPKFPQNIVPAAAKRLSTKALLCAIGRSTYSSWKSFLGLGGEEKASVDVVKNSLVEKRRLICQWVQRD
jgi:hypothetical protein